MFNLAGPGCGTPQVRLGERMIHVAAKNVPNVFMCLVAGTPQGITNAEIPKCMYVFYIYIFCNIFLIK